ncbi:MAG TPA: hypothetical protein VEY51_09680 [Chondromyces sp.]|nr:hypothetical protein [Chondromyces sp.]
MAEKKKPKYKKGDTIVITIYGTVGVITNILRVDDEFVYEINHSDGMFKEDSIVLLEEYDGVLIDKEQIDIEYRFFFGDLVRVKGYEKDLFQIVGLRTEIWRYKEDAWEDIIYELTRIPDGDWLEAHEDELVLIADSEEAERFLKKFKMLFSSKNSQKNLPAPPSPEKVIDLLLDAMNDYELMYQWFKDDYYAEKKKEIKEKLLEVVMNWQRREKKRKKGHNGHTS